jgi:AGZA family xanthine/uracil permease-like MFS transporter
LFWANAHKRDFQKNIRGGVKMLENLFKLKENNTTVRTEVLAGFTTFMTMAYILAVNPSILSASGMDSTAVLIATCLASCLGTLCMAFMANYPFALAPGMGLNAYLAFTVCLNMGYDWRVALMAVFVEGLIFIVLSLTNVREAIFNAIPSTLKKGVSAGIGLFVAFIGLQGAHLVVPNSSTIISYVNFRENWHTLGICAVLALVGLFITAVLYYKGVMGAILIGIVATWVLGMIMQACGVYVVDAENGFYSLYPSFALTDFSKLGETFGQCFQADFSNVGVLNFIVVIFSFLFVDMFDTIGTLIGVSTKAGFLDKEEKLPRVKQALLADAIATSVGAVLGTSTTTTFVESSAGVGAGGRTGLTSVVTGLLFLIAIFFAPVFTAIPGFATAPALIFVGFLMLSIVVKIEFEDFREAVPAYLTILCMPLMYSIAEGIAVGVVSYVVINVVCNLVSTDKKKITPLMYVLAVLFVCKYIFL